MTETIQYPYSKNSALLGVLLPLIFFAITFNNFRYSFLQGYILSWVIIAIADLIFLALFIFILIKRLIPALRNEVALELNEEGITDYIRNIVIEWSDVKNIGMQLGRNFSKMIIDLKEETDYGNQIAISLRWVTGKDLEICETTQAYFEEMTRLS
jgi:phosphate/sulfate permease